MKFCRYCGAQISETDTVCPKCGKVLISTAQHTKNGADGILTDAKKKLPAFEKKKGLAAVAAVVVLVIAISALVGSGTCQEDGCKNKKVSGSDYCYSHKCAVSYCGSGRFRYSNYCYSHYLDYDDDAGKSSTYVPSYKLWITDVQLSSTSVFTVAEGSITNNSDVTVDDVRIKGSFKTSSGTVVDTAWTYAVGSEGLEPGESCKWRLTVSKDSSIETCDVKILDFDY